MRLESVTGISEKSPRRRPQDNNEDYWAYVDQSIVVCDGVGSSPDAWKASRLAANEAADSLSFYKKIFASCHNPLQLHINALSNAQEKILDQAEGSETTMVIATFVNGKLFVSGVGDGRVYLRRGSDLGIASIDDILSTDERLSDAEKRERQSVLANIETQDDIEKQSHTVRFLYNNRHYIKYSLGMRSLPLPEAVYQAAYDLHPNDSILAATDGMHDNLTTHEINRHMARNEHNIAQATRALVWAAQQRMSEVNHVRCKPDDVTVVGGVIR